MPSGFSSLFEPCATAYSRSCGDRPLGTAMPRVSGLAATDVQDTDGCAPAGPVDSVVAAATVARARAAPAALRRLMVMLTSSPSLRGGSAPGKCTPLAKERPQSGTEMDRPFRGTVSRVNAWRITRD